MLDIDVSSGHEAIIAPCLQLRFLWMTDHWKHEIVSTGCSASIPRIWSVEGKHVLDEPRQVRSPLYQQLDAKRDPSGRVRALLVGQAARHHFSAAFLVEEKPDGVVIDVDVADRCTGEIESLAATYLIEASSADLHRGDGPTTLSWAHPNSRLVFEVDPPGRAVATEASLGTIRFEAHAAIDPSGQTHRFRYRWRWINAPGRQIWDHTA